MATYDKAYCPEVKSGYKDISATEANKKYIAGELENPQFFCGENCNVEFTCINLKIDRSKEIGKMKPYFAERIQGQIHSEKCDRRKKFIAEHSGDKAKNSSYHFENEKLIFDFDIVNGLDVSENSSKIVNTNGSDNNSSAKIATTKSTKTRINIEDRTFHTKNLEKIVELFEKYNSFNLNEEFPAIYDKAKKQISFNDIFKKIQGHKIDDSGYYIYYGQAHADNYNESGLILRFTGEKADLKGITAKPSVIIWKDEFERNRKKGVYKELQRYAERWKKDKKSKDSYFELYFLGKFKKARISI